MVRVLFQENVAVYCTDTNGQSTSKSRIFLNLRIEERQNRTEKEFVFCLTRDDDPLFVYVLSLRRADYEILKREQELDADFDGFPKKIIDFVTCLDSSCGSHLRGSTGDDGCIFRFDLVGKMGFKWVTVLSLPLRRVTDKPLVTHLVERIVKYKMSVNVCLKELDTLRDSLAAEQAENKSLRRLHSECMQKWEEERKEIVESKRKFEEQNEELIADKQMLTQEVSTLKEEMVDFRDRIDDLVEQVNHLEERIRTLTEELDTSEGQLHDLERRKEELEQELSDKNEETHSRIVQICELKDRVNDFNDENRKLREKLQLIRDDRDRWKSEHDKAIAIIKKLYNEKMRHNTSGNENEKLIELEKDLEDRKRTIDALTDSNTQLRTKMESLSLECEKAKKNAEAWEARCEKKELLINDLIQCRRSSPLTANPLQMQTNYGNVTPPTVYPRVLGVANWTAQITTPLRNVGSATKTSDRQRENELNSVAVTPPTEPQVLTAGAAKIAKSS